MLAEATCGRFETLMTGDVDGFCLVAQQNVYTRNHVASEPAMDDEDLVEDPRTRMECAVDVPLVDLG